MPVNKATTRSPFFTSMVFAGWLLSDQNCKLKRQNNAHDAVGGMVKSTINLVSGAKRHLAHVKWSFRSGQENLRTCRWNPWTCPHKDPPASACSRDKWSFVYPMRQETLRRRAPKGLDEPLQRSHINNKPVSYISFYHAVIRFVDVFDVNHFNIANNVMFGTVVQHFLCFG